MYDTVIHYSNENIQCRTGITAPALPLLATLKAGVGMLTGPWPNAGGAGVSETETWVCDWS